MAKEHDSLYHFPFSFLACLRSVRLTFNLDGVAAMCYYGMACTGTFCSLNSVYFILFVVPTAQRNGNEKCNARVRDEEMRNKTRKYFQQQYGFVNILKTPATSTLFAVH